MRRRKLEIIVAWLCVIDIVVGFMLAIGVFDAHIDLEPLQMFTILNALYACVYYLLEIRYVRMNKKGVLSSTWQLSILINATGMAILSVIYLQPMHATLIGSQMIALILIQYILPVLVLIQYACGPKGYFKKKQLRVVVLLPILYNVITIGFGMFGIGVGMGDTQYPYPFINVDQLGWGIVAVNVCMLMIICYVYGRIWIMMDRLFVPRGKKI